MRSRLFWFFLVGCGSSEPAPPADGSSPGDDDDSPIVDDTGPAGDTDTSPDPTGDTDTDDTGPTGCGITVQDLWPADGSASVFYRTELEVAFSQVDPTATLTVTDLGGNLVPGTSAWSGSKLVFTPDAWFQPSTSYNASLSWCGGPTGWSFTTSEIGAPVAAPVVGRTYGIDLFSGRILQPAGIGPLLQTFVGDVEWLVSPVAQDADTLDWRMGLGNGNGAQDPCSPTIAADDADFTEDPFFTFGPAPAALVVQGVTIDIYDVTLSGAFAPDATWLDGLEVTGSIDTRNISDLLLAGGGYDAVCLLTASLGIACTSCPDGEVLCLDLHVDSLLALERVGAQVVEITEAEVEANPACP